MRGVGIVRRMKNKEIEEIVRKTILSFVHKDENAYNTAQAIQAAVGPIRGVHYKDRTLGLDISSNRYKIMLRDLNNSQYARVVNDLVPTLDLVARLNGGRTEAHISGQCSTKHHKQGYNTLVEQVAAKYAI